MTSFSFEDIYQFLKKQGIIVCNYKHNQVKDNIFNNRVNIAFKTGTLKGSTYNYNLYANLYGISLKNNKNGDKKIFSFSSKDKQISWVDYLINKDIAYAEAIREKTANDCKKLVYLLDNTDVVTMEDSQKSEELEKKLKKLQNLNKYASKQVENYAKQLGERE